MAGRELYPRFMERACAVDIEQAVAEEVGDRSPSNFRFRSASPIDDCVGTVAITWSQQVYNLAAERGGAPTKIGHSSSSAALLLKFRSHHLTRRRRASWAELTRLSSLPCHRACACAGSRRPSETTATNRKNAENLPDERFSSFRIFIFGLESSSLAGSIDGFIEMLIRSPTSSKMRPPDDRARKQWAVMCV